MNIKRLIVAIMTLAICFSTIPFSAFATNSITHISFTCPADGTPNLAPPDEGFMYVYKTSSTGTDTLMQTPVVGSTVGDITISKSEYFPVNDFNWNGNPCVEIIMVATSEWEDNTETATVYSYGYNILPLTMPTLHADTITLGEIVIPSQITSPNGTYNGFLASALYQGWFADAEATIPSEDTHTSAYLAIEISTFKKLGEITASDVTLTDGTNFYTGVYSKQTSESKMLITFSVETEHLEIAIKLTGQTSGADVLLNGEATHIIVHPIEMSDDNGEIFMGYDDVAIDVSVKPGYYVRNITLNGIGLNSGNITEQISENYWGENRIYQFTEDEKYSHYIKFRFIPARNTIIEVEIGLCDIIEFDMTGIFNKIEANSYYDSSYDPESGVLPDIEDKWHRSGRYYVAETGIKTRLCRGLAFSYNDIPQNSVQDDIYLAFNPDGSGPRIEMSPFDRYYCWEPIFEEYINGTVDVITLYPIITCSAGSSHSFVHNDEVPATCQQTGQIANEYCELCRSYFEEGASYPYTRIPLSDLTTPVIDHKYTILTDTTETTHTYRCEMCDETIVSEHEYVDRECICGHKSYVLGDVNGDEMVTDADAIHLLYYTIFGSEDYSVNQPVDFNKDQQVTDADAVHLLYYTIFPDDYPLN